MVSLQNDQISDELRVCCSHELRRSLFDFVGTENLTNTDENTMLEKLKSIAVIGKNVAVHRQEFHLMSQSTGDQFNNFVSRLKAKGRHYAFTIHCTSNACNHLTNNYSCKVCGSEMHSSLERSTKCQAWGETCNYYGKSNHF